MAPPLIPSLLLTRLPTSPWALSRTLSSSNPHEPSGLVSGTAIFTPRKPTASGYAGECVYGEEGEMEVKGGVKLRFRRGYVWRFREEGEGVGGVSLWFIRPEAANGGAGGEERGGEVDYLFHELEFLPLGPEEGGDGDEGEEERNGDGSDVWKIRVKGHHLCVEDVYETEYLFRLRERRDGTRAAEVEQEGKRKGEIMDDESWDLESWEVRHTVKGPKKDQRLWSVYTRDEGA